MVGEDHGAQVAAPPGSRHGIDAWDDMPRLLTSVLKMKLDFVFDKTRWFDGRELRLCKGHVFWFDGHAVRLYSLWSWEATMARASDFAAGGTLQNE